MQLVEQIVIKPNSPIFTEIDAAAFASKNLYNAANYVIRQSFFATGLTPGFPSLAKQFINHEAYIALPRKVSQWVLKTLDKAWKAYFAAHRGWRKDPSKFLAEPKLPKYKDKESGRNLLVYTIQAISGPLLKIGQIKLSGLGFVLKTKQDPIVTIQP